MAIKEISVELVHIEAGVIVSHIKATTDKGDVGMRVSFQLKDRPKIAAAVKLLEDAIDEEVGTLQAEPKPSDALKS